MTRRTFFANFTAQSLFQVVNNVLGLIFTIFLARSVSQFQFGTYNYMFSVLLIASLFLELGVPSYFLRHWSVNREKLADEMRLFLTTRILMIIPISAFLFFYVFVIDRFVSLEFLLLYVYVLLDIPFQLIKTQNAAHDHFYANAFLDSVEKIITLGGGILILLSGGLLLDLFLLFIMGRAAVVVSGWWWYRLPFIPSFYVQDALQLIKKASPLFFVSVFTILYFRIDILLIRYLLNLEAVAPYSAAYRFLDASLILPNIIMNISVPTLTRYLHQDLSKIGRIIEFIFSVLSSIAFLLAAELILYSQDLMTLLYGNRFPEAAGVLPLLALCAIVFYLTTPLAHLFFASRKEKFHATLLFFLTLINITTNVFLIPRLGINGAAITTLVCELVAFVILFIKIGGKISYLLPVGFWGLYMLVCVAIVTRFELFWIWQGLLLAILYGCGIYSAYVLRWQKEISHFGHSLRLQN